MRFAAILALSLSTAASLRAADGVRLRIQDGDVWLSAADATVADILAEWSRVGATRITNGESVSAARVTMHVEGVPETQLLDLLLRSAGGYLAVTRSDGPPTTSRFATIVILPKSRVSSEGDRAAAAPAPAQAAPQAVSTGVRHPSLVRPLIGPDGRPVPDDQEETTPVYAQPPPPPVRPSDAMQRGWSLRPGEPTGAATPGWPTPGPAGRTPPSPQPPRSPQGSF
jgi:hypothetical protein